MLSVPQDQYIKSFNFYINVYLYNHVHVIEPSTSFLQEHRGFNGFICTLQLL